MVHLSFPLAYPFTLYSANLPVFSPLRTQVEDKGAHKLMRSESPKIRPTAQPTLHDKIARLTVQEMRQKVGLCAVAPLLQRVYIIHRIQLRCV